jgi:hypothetical protein
VPFLHIPFPPCFHSTVVMDDLGWRDGGKEVHKVSDDETRDNRSIRTHAPANAGRVRLTPPIETWRCHASFKGIEYGALGIEYGALALLNYLRSVRLSYPVASCLLACARMARKTRENCGKKLFPKKKKCLHKFRTSRQVPGVEVRRISESDNRWHLLYDNDNIIDCNKWHFIRFLNPCLSRLDRGVSEGLSVELVRYSTWWGKCKSIAQH